MIGKFCSRVQRKCRQRFDCAYGLSFAAAIWHEMTSGRKERGRKGLLTA